MGIESMVIEQIQGDGYERVAKFKREDELPAVWCHFIQHDEYLEPGEEPQALRSGCRVEGRFSIQLVLSCEPVHSDAQIGFKQELEASSHIEAVGRVTERLDDDEFIGDFGPLGDSVRVELEQSLELEVGTLVRVKGNLEWEEADG
ncbi:hypothetical protein [Paenibacillus senegalensis]|uniref:hypothetical protein n=1 Tax=Paenibacillus senegalensis TaxID=1465766 RepID=UPI000289083D|nr:hypothetical protein [Paenibacillus senegalensis]